MGLCVSVVPVGVDNKRADERGDYELHQKTRRACAVYQLHPMSSSSISRNVE